MPRLFIAVDFSADTKEKLAEIAGNLPGADWVEEDNYHLTLRFLGDVENSVCHELKQGLGSLVAPSFFLSLKGIGHFPLRGDPEVLWMGVEPNAVLSSLRNKVESCIVHRRLPKDTRKFLPHVTLAKVRHARPEWVARYIVEQSLFQLNEIPIQGYSLYSSHLKATGSEYIQEAYFPLTGILGED